MYYRKAGNECNEKLITIMHDPQIPTHADIAGELDIVADAMQQTGERMDYIGGFGEIGERGREMIGAANLARDWAKCMREKAEAGT